MAEIDREDLWDLIVTAGYVYVLSGSVASEVKVGRAMSAFRRLSDAQTFNLHIRVDALLWSLDYKQAERDAHAMLQEEGIPRVPFTNIRGSNASSRGGAGATEASEWFRCDATRAVAAATRACEDASLRALHKHGVLAAAAPSALVPRGKYIPAGAQRWSPALATSGNGGLHAVDLLVDLGVARYTVPREDGAIPITTATRRGESAAISEKAPDIDVSAQLSGAGAVAVPQIDAAKTSSDEKEDNGADDASEAADRGDDEEDDGESDDDKGDEKEDDDDEDDYAISVDLAGRFDVVGLNKAED